MCYSLRLCKENPALIPNFFYKGLKDMTKKAAGAEAQNGTLPQLVFKGDFQQDVTGEIKSGSEVTILFDAERLPFERSLDAKGKSAWTISAFYQFAPGGAVNKVELLPEKAAKKTKAENGGALLKGVLSVPTESKEAIIWFLNTGKTGTEYYDSDFGKNYRFPILPAVNGTAESAETVPAKKTRARKS